MFEKHGIEYFEDLAVKMLVLFTDKFSEVFDKSENGRFNSHINIGLHMVTLEKVGEDFTLIFEEYKDHEIEKYYYTIPCGILTLSNSGVITGDKNLIIDAYYKVCNLVDDASLSMRSKIQSILVETSYMLYIDDITVDFNESELEPISDEDEDKLVSLEARLLATMFHRQLSERLMFNIRTKLHSVNKEKVNNMLDYDADDNLVLTLRNGRYIFSDWDPIEDPVSLCRYIDTPLVYTINQKIKRKKDVLMTLDRLKSDPIDWSDFSHLIKILNDYVLDGDDDLYKW